MIPVLEFEKRALEGPVMKMDEFDLALTKTVRKLVKKYELKYNPEELFVNDDTADKVFQAGVELLAEIGLYHMDTQRVIKFTVEEIESVVKEYRDNPPIITFGRGQDEHTVVPRKDGDPRRPVVWGVAAGVIQEEWFVPFLFSIAREPVVQGFGIAGGIASVGGVVPKESAPSEIYCGLWEVRAQQEALRLAGRPDMHLGLIPTVSSVGGTLAVIGPGLREAHNSMVGIHIIPEQKIDWTRLNLAQAIQERGISPWTSAMSLLGGLGGGPAGVAVIMMANFIGQLSYGHGKLGSFYVNDMTGRASHREALWTLSACFRAAGRNIGVATGAPCSDSGPVFSMEEAIIRGVAMAVTLTTCSGAYNWCSGIDGITARVHADVMEQVAPITGQKANELLQSISRLLDELVQAGGNPLSFNERAFPYRYDIEKVEPKPEYVDQVKRAVEMLAKAGVPFSSNLVLD